jgi:hypothetical protein
MADISTDQDNIYREQASEAEEYAREEALRTGRFVVNRDGWGYELRCSACGAEVRFSQGRELGPHLCDECWDVL